MIGALFSRSFAGSLVGFAPAWHPASGASSATTDQGRAPAGTPMEKRSLARNALAQNRHRVAGRLAGVLACLPASGASSANTTSTAGQE